MEGSSHNAPFNPCTYVWIEVDGLYVSPNHPNVGGTRAAQCWVICLLEFVVLWVQNGHYEIQNVGFWYFSREGSLRWERDW